MARLGDNVARILKQQSAWRQNLPGGLNEGPTRIRGTGSLEEIEHFGPNPGNLGMLRYTPSDLGPNPALVVVLHGCTQSAAAYADGAGWIELADRFGFCLLMPEQRRSNNPNLCFNWFLSGDTTRGSGEVSSIHHMIAHTIAESGIDSSRVYVTGLSAGGAMTSAMLATYPEMFAGGAIVAGLPYQSATDIPGAFQVMGEARTMPAHDWAGLVRSASDHRGTWPRVSIWHGDADRTVDPGNAQEITKQWTGLHGLQAPDLIEPHESYTRRAWHDASGQALVEEYVVPGLGHGTPLATGDGDEHFGAAAPFLLEAGLSSSLRIAQFWQIADEEFVAQTARPAALIVAPEPEIVTDSARVETARKTAEAESTHDRYDIGGIINRALKNAGLMN